MGWPSYLLHGTNKPKAVGRRASSGCVRMYADHIEWIYNNVPVGTMLTSVNQPIKMAWIDGELFLEAEPNDIQIDELEYQNRQITIDIPDGVIGDIRRKAGEDVARVNWEKVRQVLIQRTGIPTLVTRPADGKGPQIPIKAIGHVEQVAKDTDVVERALNAEREAMRSAADPETSEPVDEIAKPQPKYPARRTDWDNLN
jgi:hypothetical protein